MVKILRHRSTRAAPTDRRRVISGAEPLERWDYFEHLALRVLAEFREMPGLRLTMPQAQRLCGLNIDTCHRVIDALVTRSILKRGTGMISLANGGHVRPRFRIHSAPRDRRNCES